LKELLQQPRPFVFDPGVMQLAAVDGYGLPSGHSQTAVILWGYLAAKINKVWAWILAVAIILLIGLSRIGLGLHFPTDLLGGWIIGGIMLFSMIKYDKAIMHFFANLYLTINYLLGFVAPAMIAFVEPIPFFVSLCGTLSGVWVGILVTRKITFSKHIQAQSIVNYLLGMTILLILFSGLKKLFPAAGDDYYLVLKYVRYWVVGCWVCLYGFLSNNLSASPTLQFTARN